MKVNIEELDHYSCSSMCFIINYVKKLFSPNTLNIYFISLIPNTLLHTTLYSIFLDINIELYKRI